MPEPDLQVASEPPPTVSALDILKQAMAKVPALKYALGVAGLAAAVAIVRTLISDLRVALFGIILMLVLMTVLFVFARLTAVASKEIRLAALVLMWFSLLLTVASASLLFTSIFFDWPVNLKHLISPTVAVDPPRPADHPAPQTTYLKGAVIDFHTREVIANATVEVEWPAGKTFARTTTMSNGGFAIEEIPAKPGDNATIHVSKADYKRRDEPVALPGPKTIYLEKSR